MAFRAAAAGALALTAILAVPVVYSQSKADASPAPSITKQTALAVGAPGRLMGRLSQGEADATITLLGDSTGNDQTEWFFQLASWVAKRYPGYRTTYRLWNHKKQAYGSPIVLNAGDSGRTLSFYNGSVGGAKAGYAIEGNRLARLTAQGGDLFLVNYSHNESRATSYPAYRQLTERLAAKASAPDVVPVLQNPEGAPDKTSAQRYAHTVRLRGIQALAAEKGWSTVDAYRQFTADKRPLRDLVPDGVHPNAAGQALWLNAAKTTFLR